VQDRERSALQQVRSRFEVVADVTEAGSSSWRTVMTNCGPAKTWISPNSTVSVAST
jgi:hypothetical protein